MRYVCEQDKFPSVLFSEAVREHHPVCILEDMRNMKPFCWEEDSEQQSYTPAEALMYAIIHDHRVYARHLLDQFSDAALDLPGQRFCSCPSHASHLGTAVCHGRKYIINLILQAAHKSPSLGSYINRCGCNSIEYGKSALHVACQLLDPDVVTTLLGNGASPRAEDHNSMTPLDYVLEQIWTSTVKTGTKILCLERLLMFMPEIQFKMKSSLINDAQYWSQVLGESNFSYLVGKSPASLFLISMQRTLSQLPRQEFAKSLDQLPIPTLLKPLMNP